MTIPFLDLSRPWLRLCCALLCLLIPLSSGVWLLQSDYKAGLQQASVIQSRHILGHIEAIIEQAEHTNQQVQPLLDQSCNEARVLLSKTAALATFVRSISLAHNGQFYCSSIFGAMEWHEQPAGYVQGKLLLQPGNPVSPNHPFLSVRQSSTRGEVVTVIDSDYLVYPLVNTSNIIQSWLKVGDRMLDQHGKLLDALTMSHSPYLGSASSPDHPITVYSIADTAPGIWPLWHAQRISLIVLFSLSLFTAVATWWVLGRPRSPIGELARAIRAQEFVPFLQPLVNARTHDIRGVEVLMRWRHPTVGIISPDLFIPQAEASGLIMPMTLQLMHKVAHALSPHISLLPDNFYISFNISSSCCKGNGLLTASREFLSHFPAGKIQLSFELTERETLTNDAQTLALFQQLDALGVKLAIDDFGTGHSSLLYLQQFQVETLKIDQSFVRHIGTEHISRHIVDNVIDLGLRLNIKLIAEGVETALQANYLAEKGVHMLQGYLFGRPLAIERFLQQLAEERVTLAAPSMAV